MLLSLHIFATSLQYNVTVTRRVARVTYSASQGLCRTTRRVSHKRLVEGGRKGVRKAVRKGVRKYSRKYLYGVLIYKNIKYTKNINITECAKIQNMNYGNYTYNKIKVCFFFRFSQTFQQFESIFAFLVYFV